MIQRSYHARSGGPGVHQRLAKLITNKKATELATNNKIFDMITKSTDTTLKINNRCP